ncbi:cation-dependent mannose-6-phosphate receptor-like [Mobula birostris]|uniref:cation-dependent mannose-6-phosphate receptor-like n=1 Tax=Mobula birostris TaxID=1983395 RepID=UPI003B27D37E
MGGARALPHPVRAGREACWSRGAAGAMAPPLAPRLLPLLAAALSLAPGPGSAARSAPPSGDCDLLGDGAAESAIERVLLERLRPLRGKSFSVTTENATTKESYTYRFQLCASILPGDPTAGAVQIDNKVNTTKVIGRINATQLIGGSECGGRFTLCLTPGVCDGTVECVMGRCGGRFTVSLTPGVCDGKVWREICSVPACLPDSCPTCSGDWILLLFGDGDPYKTHCQGERRKVLLMISCEPGVVSGRFAVTLEQREKVSDCFYLFEMDSSVACPRNVKKLSTGSVLLILFVTLLSIYLLGGFLYQRLVLKAKGMDQFPNHSFWQEVGNLTADGCDFVFRSRSRSPPPSYRGVGSQPLGAAEEEEEEDRDEHLLPM